MVCNWKLPRKSSATRVISATPAAVRSLKAYLYLVAIYELRRAMFKWYKHIRDRKDLPYKFSHIKSNRIEFGLVWFHQV